jgi:four helix bundle protein
MATISRFEDLDVWQKARTLSRNVYEIISGGKFSKDYKLREQINGSCGSIMDNIAEGFERGGTKEFVYSLGIAKGSAGEIRSQLYRALDRKYIENEKFNELYQIAEQISRMINGLIAYLNKTKYRGEKFKVKQTLLQIEVAHYKA